MKNSKITRDGSKTGFFSGKGFYIALAVSLVAVGGAAWIGINSSLDKLNDNNSLNLDNTPSQVAEPNTEWGLPSEQEAAKPQSDVPANENNSASSENNNSNAAQSFIMPLKGSILNPYSGDKVVKSKTLDQWEMHTGIDIAAKVSTPVKAVSAGKVIEIKNDSMWGACVIIEHPNGYESHYYNLKSAVNVKKNQTVKLGDVIGSVGTSAEIERAEESHLHFAMKQNSKWVDPMSLLK